eukprot:768354-Hanusia_phi.AAC.4
MQQPRLLQLRREQEEEAEAYGRGRADLCRVGTEEAEKGSNFKGEDQGTARLEGVEGNGTWRDEGDDDLGVTESYSLEIHQDAEAVSDRRLPVSFSSRSSQLTPSAATWLSGTWPGLSDP